MLRIREDPKYATPVEEDGFVNIDVRAEAVPSVVEKFARKTKVLEAQGANDWTQIGKDIQYYSTDLFCNRCLSLSKDGKILAVGSPTNNQTYSGRVQVFQNTEDSWSQLGEDIAPGSSLDTCGNAVSLSSDGTTLAVGFRLNREYGFERGLVRVYKYGRDTKEWEQMGGDIIGTQDGEQCGFSVSLSADGGTVAVGCAFNNGNGIKSGVVRVCEFVGNGGWRQRGGDIYGKALGDLCGYSTSISEDGKIVCVGSPLNQDGGVESGHTRVFMYRNDEWGQIGGDIRGNSVGDKCGWAVCLSANGCRVAISSPFNSDNGIKCGHVRVFECKDNNWEQLGRSISGKAAGDRCGHSISFTGDGQHLAVGSPLYSFNAINRGNARVYKFVPGEDWVRRGQDVVGGTAGDCCGAHVCLSTDASVVAIGSPKDLMDNQSSVKEAKVCVLQLQGE